ncbi:MAG: formyltransferase [Candidatus Competibacteraceae bacterium]|nr:formyltransferase [Candidatus Competibacteraceae bacterium]MCB1822025.1 formyltransferase [Candidatus Competibacteraceae bacterium]HRY16204.1 formyltransferase [Candidatus Competibacteraceae bacterium]
MTRAVVFAYHNVGVRCLKTLLAQNIDVALVLTHQDNPNEQIWFDCVSVAAADYGIPTITPENPNHPEIVQYISELAPDFLFSFYYRCMLSPELLAIAPRGALNLHGSLLPKYRGRAPVNWAVLYGETETGATLHYMTAKPDAGDIVAQTAVPILPDDTAREVFDKVTVAAEMTLHNVLPALVSGTAPRLPQDLSRGGYFPGRKPEDGRIDWNWPAMRIHNLVRAVAPPYPGAFTTVAGQPARILRTRVLVNSPSHPHPSPPRGRKFVLEEISGRLITQCGDEALQILTLDIAGQPAFPGQLTGRLGPGPWRLGD